MSEIPPRLRRAMELVYAVEGVTAARIWHWRDPKERIAIGVRGSATASPAELLRRVEAAVAGLREPGEEWEFGVLEES